MMHTTPDAKTATAQLKNNKPCLLYSECIADLETPVSVMLKLGADSPPSCLLESVEGGTHRGRFSVVAIAPDLIWTVNDNQITTRDVAGNIINQTKGNALTALRQLIADSRLDLPPDLPPMAAGLFGYFGYEMIQHMEKIPTAKPTAANIATPDAWLMRPTLVVVIDRLKDSMLLATVLRPTANAKPDAVYDAGVARLTQAQTRLAQVLPATALTPDTGKDGGNKDGDGNKGEPLGGFEGNMSKAEFMAGVEAGIEYIKAGEVFQVLLSQRFQRRYTRHPFGFYRALRRLNPSPFLFYFNIGDFTLAGSSPEFLVRLRGDKITIRPIAGTRPRGATAAADQALGLELLADAKERAEHLMLLDLGRNDTGRVAAAGSVKLVEHFAIERYSHVMHIASEVEGRLRAGFDTVDALVAGFPAGTVTGAPKIRAMELIHQLEPCRRGTYAGAAGYIAANGDMDTCIMLRTALIKDATMYIQAGAGIVYDSVPEREYEETINKARALLHAAAISDKI